MQIIALFGLAMATLTIALPSTSQPLFGRQVIACECIDELYPLQGCSAVAQCGGCQNEYEMEGCYNEVASCAMNCE